MGREEIYSTLQAMAAFRGGVLGNPQNHRDQSLRLNILLLLHVKPLLDKGVIGSWQL